MKIEIFFCRGVKGHEIESNNAKIPAYFDFRKFKGILQSKFIPNLSNFQKRILRFNLSKLVRIMCKIYLEVQQTITIDLGNHLQYYIAEYQRKFMRI